MTDCEIAVVGGGIAGASIASALVGHLAAGAVCVLEMEDSPGYHTTGRSAALFSKTYGPSPVRALSRASETFFKYPPDGFSDYPLLAPRGMLITARQDQEDALSRMVEELAPSEHLQVITEPQARRLCPLLRRGYATRFLWDDHAQDIDVHALHQGFLRRVRARGGLLWCNAEVTAIARDGHGWRIETTAGDVRAGLIVNAAGAWADDIARLAGAVPLSLRPLRRSAAIIRAPAGIDLSAMRMVIDVEEQFYLKPEAGTLLISPADETLSEPCDAQPDELDIAISVDRIERAFELRVRRVERKWAGLRSFVADGVPVAGFDPEIDGFFWLAGQGGYGIQTAPALGQLAAALVLGHPPASDFTDNGVVETDFSPGRLSRAI